MRSWLLTHTQLPGASLIAFLRLQVWPNGQPANVSICAHFCAIRNRSFPTS